MHKLTSLLFKGNKLMSAAQSSGAIFQFIIEIIYLTIEIIYFFQLC